MNESTASEYPASSELAAGPEPGAGSGIDDGVDVIPRVGTFQDGDKDGSAHALHMVPGAATGAPTFWDALLVVDFAQQNLAK